MAEELNTFLAKAYYDVSNPVGFTGVLPLYRLAKRKFTGVTLPKVRRWLAEQDVYTLHKPLRKHFKRNRVYVNTINELWQMDLADLSSLKKYNRGYKYILTCIDVFSKFAWAVPLRDKSGKVLVKAFRAILRSGRRPDCIQTDRGTEFLNKLFQGLLKENNIRFYTTGNETKASVAERFNRTMKGRMYKYFTHKNTYKYYDILQKLVDAYNNSYHRSIKMKPTQVNERNQHVVRENLYGNEKRHSRQFKFKIGDQVRVSKAKLRFEKSYLVNYSEEIFTISKRYPRNPPVYVLKDFLGEVISGTFYEHELQKVFKAKDALYEIEKVLKRRKRNGKTEYFVKWKNYPEKFNSWVDSLVDPNK